MEMGSLPTLTEYNQQKKTKADIRIAEFVQLKESYAKDIDIHSSSSESYRNQLRNKVDQMSVSMYQIRCNYCGTQLVNPEPLSVMLSYPPKYHIACAGCGWSGYHIR